METDMLCRQSDDCGYGTDRQFPRNCVIKFRIQFTERQLLRLGLRRTWCHLSRADSVQWAQVTYLNCDRKLVRKTTANLNVKFLLVELIFPAEKVAHEKKETVKHLQMFPLNIQKLGKFIVKKNINWKTFNLQSCHEMCCQFAFQSKHFRHIQTCNENNFSTSEQGMILLTAVKFISPPSRKLVFAIMHWWFLLKTI